MLLLAGLEFSKRRRRRKLLARFRAEWGHRSERARNIQAISRYHRVLTTEDESPLDERTGQDLDLDALFAVLDRTVSPVGRRLLYHRLRTTPASDNLNGFEALMTRLAEDAKERERIQMSLARLREDSGDVWWLTQPGVLDIKRGDVIFPLLAPVVPAAFLLATVWPEAIILAILGILTNVTVRYVTAPRLSPLLHPFRQIGPLLATAETLGPLIATDGVRVGPSLSADLTRLTRLRRIVSWVSRDPLMSDDYSSAVFEALNMLLLLDVNVLYFASTEMRANSPALLRTIATIGTVDAAISVASYRAGTIGWTRPVLQSHAGSATMTDLRHPLLVEAVPNSIALAPPHGILVTGSNMSGKSTFLRTLGVNAVLAQTVNTCLAAAYSAPVFAVRSVIGRSDNLMAGKSYYRDEVEAVLALVHASRSRLPHLFLFDELFRGTSTVERIAAAEAVLVELLSHDQEGQTDTPHIVMVATHDRELVDLLQGVYAPYYFSDTVGSDGLSFDYQLREGPASSWNAIALLEICGAPARVVKRAYTRTAGLDDQRRIGPGSDSD